jgi:L-threonine-O-3-phosphate decarboxylase
MHSALAVRAMKARHGGNLRAIAAGAGREPGDILDFSANVNPLGPPEAVRRILHAFAESPARLATYPDPAYQNLRDALARRHGIDRKRIVVGNGSAALIGAVVRALLPERCVVPVPAFSEYAKALDDARVDVRHVPLARGSYELDAAAILRVAGRTGATLCIVANPNNPTGAVTARETVGALARDLARIGCTLAIDEAFVDYAPDASCASDDLPAIVLRSLTKFFAIPGVRIGYAVAPEAVASAIADVFPSWPVGTMETEIALAALGDVEFVRETRETNAIERARLASALRSLGLHVLAGAANFVFADLAPLHVTAAPLAATLLARDGIAIRTCDDYDGLGAATFVRIAVRTPLENDRLLAALEAAIPAS